MIKTNNPIRDGVLRRVMTNVDRPSGYTFAHTDGKAVLLVATHDQDRDIADCIVFMESYNGGNLVGWQNQLLIDGRNTGQVCNLGTKNDHSLYQWYAISFTGLEFTDEVRRALVARFGIATTWNA